MNARTKRNVSLITLGLLVGSAVSANALSIQDQILLDIRGGVTPDITIKYNNYDMGTLYKDNVLTPAADKGISEGNVATGIASADSGSVILAPAANPNPTNEDSWGIAKVTSIVDNDTNPLYQDGDYNTRITAIFHGVTDYWVKYADNNQTVNSVGMQLDLYLDTAPTDFSPSLGGAGRTGANTYTTVTDGILLLSLRTIPGFINAPGLNGGNMAEFESVFNISNSRGSSKAFFSVVGGVWASEFDTNTYKIADILPANDGLGLEDADGSIESTIQPNAGRNKVGDWLAQSFDPVRLSIKPIVPEPVSASLSLSALAALAFAGTRRRQA